VILVVRSLSRTGILPSYYSLSLSLTRNSTDCILISRSRILTRVFLLSDYIRIMFRAIGKKSKLYHVAPCSNNRMIGYMHCSFNHFRAATLEAVPNSKTNHQGCTISWNHEDGRSPLQWKRRRSNLVTSCQNPPHSPPKPKPPLPSFELSFCSVSR
jgi:hypothetical protein